MDVEVPQVKDWEKTQEEKIKKNGSGWDFQEQLLNFLLWRLKAAVKKLLKLQAELLLLLQQ